MLVCCRFILATTACLLLTGGWVHTTSAQTPSDQFDRDRYLQGLRELALPEVLEHYLASNPPDNDIERRLASITLKQAGLTTIASAPQRLQAVEELLAERDAVLRAAPADPRRAVWLADQAADIFFELLPIDALNLTSLFGLPSDQQRQRAAGAASRMLQYARDAEQAIDVAIRSVEALPDFARNPSLQQRRRALADIERDRRIPFLLGVASYLNAELNLADSDPARRAGFDLATATLAPLTETLEGSLALTSRLYDGLALARLGRFEQAEARFASVARDPAATPADTFAARCGGVLNRLVRGGPTSALEALASIEDRYRDPALLFYRVLIADLRFRLLRQQAANAPPADRSRVLNSAFAAYTDLLKINWPAGTIARDAIRAIVQSRLVTAAASVDITPSQLPPVVVIAKADALSCETNTREQAIVMLEGVLRSGSLAADDRASALFALGRALFEHNQPLLAARRFEQLAREHPADAHAERAVELATTLAWEEHRRSPSDAEARSLLRESLTLVLDRYPNLSTIDRWRYVSGRLAMNERRFDEAMSLFSQVTPASSQYHDAAFMQAATARDRAITLGTSPSAAVPLHQQTLQIIQRTQPILEQALSSATSVQRRAALQYYLGMMRVYAAEATLALGDAQRAIDLLEGIEGDASVGGDCIGEALRVRVNAWQALRKPDEAQRDLQRFVETSPAQAGAVLGPMTASLISDVRQALDSGRENDAKDLANRTLLPAARTLENWLSTPDAPSDRAVRSTLEQRVADAYRYAGDCDAALMIYERLLRAMPDAVEPLLGKAECLFALGGEQRLADAMTIYRRLSAAGPGSAGHEAYWLSQLRMLEILDITGRGTHQILPRIERLRQNDATFGGERYRRGFDALRLRHAGAGT